MILQKKLFCDISFDAGVSTEISSSKPRVFPLGKVKKKPSELNKQFYIPVKKYF